MRPKHVNLWMALVAAVLFSFSCFSIIKLIRTSNQLINCQSHVLEFKENMRHLKNKAENNRQKLITILTQIRHEIAQRANVAENLVQRKPDTLSKNETVYNTFEALKFFLPHLRKEGRVYPDVIIGKGKTGVSFALGISTVNRGNHSYLKQTLTSVVSRMTLSEEKDSVVIVSIADSDKDYIHSVVDMIRKRFKKQVKSGSLEVISVPAFLYPDLSNVKQPTEDSQLKSRRIKQVLDFCILMLYAQPKAMYYLQLEDDVIAKKMYLTKITDFVHHMTSSNWLYLKFSMLGFIGKLFRSEDLPDFVRFFLMFYKEKPIDLLLNDFFQVKMCDSGESLKICQQRMKEICVQYKPSLFQHVGIHSSFPGREQHLQVQADGTDPPGGGGCGGDSSLAAPWTRRVEPGARRWGGSESAGCNPRRPQLLETPDRLRPVDSRSDTFAHLIHSIGPGHREEAFAWDLDANGSRALEGGEDSKNSLILLLGFPDGPETLVLHVLLQSGSHRLPLTDGLAVSVTLFPVTLFLSLIL
ncbi:alpha-1,3-mannosyl-glycoprotein 4-beta-N-acetylglucosaminyltransferase-like protein MGAT4D [Carlito syrichta]|uniref:Alpha-1,3-mannosyl-glycoprotein 4-beta-N-acetylglucosaminyltransferase-like protein MGAT4D n=1 Tax=Carlito syrichta TaxID=1868482 RepID=A0A1U7T5M9_CARSF|nr:alpha-1,3-mannosyl-glycoprotein 4-beta-N-acetylglucosaminyltransferase-like protein MGAT4D [Carlito syrichta]